MAETTSGSPTRAYTDVKTGESSELTPYVIQEVLLLLCEAEV